MDKVEERKQKFVILLEGELDRCKGVKGDLAKKLEVKPSTLTHWLQGKIDPSSLDATTFIRIAKHKKISVNELATLLGIIFNESGNSLEKKFENLIQELLFNKSQAELAQRLGVKANTISSWVASNRQINPAKISIATMAAIAFEKGWTIERLFIYLGFKNIKNANELEFKIKSITTDFSLSQQIELLAWLSTLISKTAKSSSIILKNNLSQSNHNVIIIIDKNDASIASNYLKNLNNYTQLNLDNIEITTALNIPESLKDFNLLLFDIETNPKSNIELINKISFNGNIVIFAPQDLESEIRQQLEDKVTDIVVKPIDWNSLKDKPYFTST